MEDRLSRWLLLPPLLALLFLSVLYQYAAPGGGCPSAPPPPPAASAASPCHPGFSLPAGRRLRPPQAAPPAAAGPRPPGSSRREFSFGLPELCRRVRFDMRARDVMVFLHIQKTGGTTFGRHLVRNIRLEQPCECRAGQKKCTCHRPGGSGRGADTWLFSRFSTGWSCGLHADWTELTSCVPAAMDRRGGCPANRTLRLRTTMD